MKKRIKDILPAFLALGIVLLSCGCVQNNGAGTQKESTTSSPETTSEPAALATSIAATSITSTSVISLPTTSTSTSTSLTTTSSTSTTTTTSIDSKYNVKASVTLPKEQYRSGERMDITVKIESPQNLSGVDVNVYGIYAKYYRLNKTEPADLAVGINTVQFTYTTPPCNTCSGIGAGDYAIAAEIFYDGKMIAKGVKGIRIDQ